MAIQEQYTGVTRHGSNWINHMIDIGVITDTSLGGLTTVAGLLASFDTAVVSEQDSNLVRQAKKAIQMSANVGGLTDAQVAVVGGTGGGGRIAALRAALVASDPNLSGTERNVFAI